MCRVKLVKRGEEEEKTQVKLVICTVFLRFRVCRKSSPFSAQSLFPKFKGKKRKDKIPFWYGSDDSLGSLVELEVTGIFPLCPPFLTIKLFLYP